MYNIGNLILNGTMVVTTFWIVNRFLGSVYEKRQGNVWSILVWIVYGIFQVYTQINAGDASVITTLVSIILVTLISITTYYGFSKFNILIIVLFHAAWALVEMIVFFCMNLILAENIYTDMRIPLERNSLHASAGRLSAPNGKFLSYTGLRMFLPFSSRRNAL